MLLRIRDLRGDRIHAEDGEVGSVGGLYLDEAWDVRYLAVDMRRWMPGRCTSSRQSPLAAVAGSPHAATSAWS